MKKKNALILGIPLVTTIVSGALLSSNYVSADEIVDEINITVPMSCTMSGTGMDTHNANINNGTYTPDIGTTTMHVFCNDNEGFSIYAAGYTGDEIGGTNSNKLVGTSASGNATIESGLATSAGNPDVSNWAMKLAITQDSGDTTGTNAFVIDSAPNVENGEAASFSQYHVVPNEYTKVAHKVTSTDMTANTGGAKITSTYAAYISKTQAADTYTGQVIYTLVHPADVEAPVVACRPDGTTISTITCMQDITFANKSTILASMTSEQQYILKDKRDGKAYTVSKLADGNIWMTQNLDLDLDSSKTYTNLDTDLGWNGASYSAASWTPERSTYTTGTTTWGLYDDITEESDGFTHPESYDPGNIYWTGTLSDNPYEWEDYYGTCYDPENDEIDYDSCDESLNPTSTYLSSTGIQQYHLGNYYNWTAAVALNNSSDYATDDQSPNQSICPTGWTISVSYANTEIERTPGSFRYLIEQYGWDDYNYRLSDDAKIWNHPFYRILSGIWEGRFDFVANQGNHYLSTVKDSFDAYSTYYEYDGFIAPRTIGLWRSTGLPVRCTVRSIINHSDDP